MEEKKTYNSTIAAILIFLTIVWFYRDREPDKETSQKKEVKQQVGIQKAEDRQVLTIHQDSVKSELISLENDLIALKVNTLGGYIQEIRLKKERNFRDEPIFLAKDNSTTFSIVLPSEGLPESTSGLTFQSTFSQDQDKKVLLLNYNFSKEKQITFQYELPNEGYLVRFHVHSKGLNIKPTKTALVNWSQKSFLQSKSTSYENRYTEIIYLYEEDKSDYLNVMSTSWDEEDDEKIDWIAYKQHFFTSILESEIPFEKSLFKSRNLVKDEDIDTIFTKEFLSISELPLIGGELNHGFNWYFGPSEYEVLKSYRSNFTEIMPLGWGIFGWFNAYIFLPLFGFLTSFFPHGIAIILMTLIIRLILSPVTYKSYLSQTKMRIIRPEINEINEKYKKDAMKKQQELMKLYSISGVSPLSGCLPALMQLPIFYALFNFFPSAYELRQKSFLWAEDLSSYDSIYELPFRIPFYGDHVSLLPILASIAIFFYMRLTTGDTPQPTQPGMPNMKFMIYLSPIMMLFFFNNYASGLSLYYFISNLITIFIMLAIRNYILDESKIHNTIKQKQNDPNRKSGNRFQRKMQMLMEQQQQLKK